MKAPLFLLQLEPSAISITSSADEKFLRKLMGQIEEGIPISEYNVNTLEKEMSISHTHFYRKVKCLTGFNNPGYFSKCFKKKYGMTPSEYINKQKEISS